MGEVHFKSISENQNGEMVAGSYVVNGSVF